jgi:glycosyltransferase involved in cell wall biosynthesis
MSDPATREAMGSAGRTRYEARFRLERMVDETAALYRELLGAEASPAVRIAQGNGRLRLT